jgi:hypothetical protein
MSDIEVARAALDRPAPVTGARSDRLLVKAAAAAVVLGTLGAAADAVQGWL